MDPLTLTDLAEMAGGTLSGSDGAPRITRISKDTRTLQVGDLYWALRGENFDGGVFVADAVERGAAAVVVDRPEAATGTGAPVILVEDTLAALHRLAAAWRNRLSLKVLCITGSNGKTSTKEFAAAVLGSQFHVTKTVGNLNNHIGVPLSIVAATSQDSAAVWEIGMNHPGEIAPLAALARPDAAIITNIGVAHIEYMKTREAIALEKGMLAEAVPAEGAVILSSDDDWTDSIAARCKARVIRAGFAGGFLSATNLRESEEGMSFEVVFEGRSHAATIPANGTHMVRNALLALAAGLEFGIPVEKAISGLATARLADGRLQRRIIHGVIFLDDTYNANPDSMEAALNTLRALPGSGRRIAVLGRMGELGDYAAEGYRRTGDAAGRLVDVLVTVGDETSDVASAARSAGLGRIHEVTDTVSAALMIKNLARPGDIVLVKGSRSSRMEDVLEHFKN